MRVRTGVEGFDPIVGGGLPEGTSIVLQGPSGNEKDLFGLQFLAEGLRSGEAVVIVVSSQSPEQYLESLAKLGVNVKEAIAGNRIKIVDWHSYQETNVAGEASKFGYRPDALLREVAQINALKRIEIHGLMTLAPWTREAEKARPVFRRLRELKTRCEQILGAPLAHLSMGMSGDFEVAIEEGATIVRLGTALFGPRPPAQRKEEIT